ncbi:MAG TPA: hypothetical protein VF120_12145 [Ktedonobacterales bacterium]
MLEVDAKFNIIHIPENPRFAVARSQFLVQPMRLLASVIASIRQEDVLHLKILASFKELRLGRARHAKPVYHDRITFDVGRVLSPPDQCTTPHAGLDTVQAVGLLVALLTYSKHDMLEPNSSNGRRRQMQQPTTSDKPDDASEADKHEAEEREAKRQGQIRRNQAAIDMLNEWMQEDPEEQRETWELLGRAFNEERIEPGEPNHESNGSATELNTRRSVMQQPTTQQGEPSNEALEAKREEQIRRSEALIALLNEWAQGDAEEQRRTWELLERGLQENPITFRRPEL